jgi:hypothetical protein
LVRCDDIVHALRKALKVQIRMAHDYARMIVVLCVHTNKVSPIQRDQYPGRAGSVPKYVWIWDALVCVASF